MVEGKFNKWPFLMWLCTSFSKISLGICIFFSSSTCRLMKRMLFLLDSEWLERHRKVWCGCALKLFLCWRLCMAGFAWREGLRLSPKGHRALPFLVQRIAALNNSFLRNWTRVSCSGHVSVRLHTYSASWWAAWGAWPGFCRLLATAAGGWWPRCLLCWGLSVQKQTSGQVSVLFGHHLGEPHVMLVIISVCQGALEGLGAPCVSWHSAAPGVLARWTEVLESLCSQGDRMQLLFLLFLTGSPKQKVSLPAFCSWKI